ncbi:MAG: class A beta-lactamase [Muribaculaceae bacterium]|nr:class A beta-lactamase [Muribaculaceae bacterium]MDE6609724.1 class A beta-lactamase [Muribaculaceae bacterium]
MRNFAVLWICVAVVALWCSVRGVAADRRYEHLQRRLDEFVSGKDARIGIGLIIDGCDTVAVNGRRDFPMLSVYKFPQALAVADFCLRNGKTFADSVYVNRDEMKPDTYSPMRDRYGVADMSLPIDELLRYSVQQSDNNACDILFRMIGGPAVADSLMKELGYGNIVIESTEDEMHADIYLCYLNRSTPVEMAMLLDRFYTEMRHAAPEYMSIAEMMETCETGIDRIVAGLPPGAAAGHKTGTGDRNSQGRLIGINDCGYVRLADGRRYSLAVFVSDSAYSMNETAAIIAEVSRIISGELTE